MNWKHFFSRYGALCALVVVGAALGITYMATGDPEPDIPLPPAPTATAVVPSATQRVPDVVITPLPRPTADDSQQTGLFGKDVQLILPAEGEIQRPYSMDRLIYQPTLKEYATHAGMDIACLEAQDIVAAADGQVESVYSDPLQGNCILIRHENDLSTLYAGLDTSCVEEGQKVKSGDPIGTAGNSGKWEVSQGVHLHFEVRKNGDPVDPADYLAS